MNESHKYSESERCVVYKQTDGYMELSMIFNKEIVDPTQGGITPQTVNVPTTKK